MSETDEYLDHHGLTTLVGNIQNRYVSKNTKINGKPLTSDIVLTLSDFGVVHLMSISIVVPPAKTEYVEGTEFDPTGMVVEASYSDGSTVIVEGYDILESRPLELMDTYVTIRYTDSGIDRIAVQPISVVPNAPHIYGVEWDWTDGGLTKGSRTDDAVLFPDPVVSFGNRTGSSPFDDLMPWAGMVKETRAGGVEVKEPKYWFKWTKTGKKLKLQIADGPIEGFHVDPVNMDRGDGLGELDFSYIGRYHCSKDNYESLTNTPQAVNMTRSEARDAVHALGDYIWLMDFAQFWYIGMLMLVEFANWNGQKVVGQGGAPNKIRGNNGGTDAMPYHTGTTAESLDTPGFTQYRNIEGYWDNVYDWVDGCYNNENGLNVILNPNHYNDDSGGALVGLPTNGYPSDFVIPSASGFEWALYPNVAGGSTTTYTTDMWYYTGDDPCLLHGGTTSAGDHMGPFCLYCYSVTLKNERTGFRLQERPPRAEVS